jgi:predicted branched-subunit amino acid permease
VANAWRQQIFYAALPCKWDKSLTEQTSQQCLWQHSEFIQGARDMLPVAPGMVAWGMMTGVAMMNSGLSLVESLAMTLTVFAGSSQLAAMPLMVAGAPMWVVLATGMCVNLRFVVFSLHLRPYFMHQPLWRRLMSGYFTTDISYVMFVRRFAHPVQASDLPTLRAQEAYLAGSCAVNWVSWMVASIAGITLANFIPVQWGLGFAGILALLGIACSLASSQLRIVSATIAGAAAVAAYALPLKLNIVVAICAAVVVCMSLHTLRPKPGPEAKP